MMKKSTLAPERIASTTPPSKGTTALEPPSECPPDVEQLGRSSWTLLHTVAASYPERPSVEQQRDATSFIGSISRLYPCYWCATDFQKWMKEASNAPRVSSRQEFGQWLCEAHNEVNQKLGKELFDCSKVDERWRTGWKDGRCE
jgi:FAD-linked sulfhydryl oxidase